MTVSKTKAKLVDVARQLFAKMGVENTTMNDIALASKKGRRTLYTYFKSKDEIYLAVVESELDILSDMMKRVAEKNISPDEKLLELIYTRLDAVKEVVYRNGTLRANFFRDIWRVEKVRKKFDAKEIQFFKAVLLEGQAKGVFHIDDVEMTKMGVENTTMNDIALASKKGRRTLYTYFKSKDEIYLAVVESELDILSDMMKRVAEKNISPDEKLLEMIYTRLDAVKEVVYRNGTLRAYFFRDIWRVEKVRKKFDAKEVQLFKAVLLEGQAKGVFHIDDVEMTADLIHYCVKGIEVPYIRGHIGAHLDEDTRNKYVSNIVFGALHRTEI